MLTSLPEKFLVATIPHELGDVKIYDNGKIKIAQSPWYNYMFNKENGQFVRWGKTIVDDPTFAPAPEILDIEVSSICSGIPNKEGKQVPCQFCYKSNTCTGINMSFETFKQVIDKMPKILTQIAIGVGDIDSNPDLWKMMEYCRGIGIIPNITVNGYNINVENSTKLAGLCGAIAVSQINSNLKMKKTIKLRRKKG